MNAYLATPLVFLIKTLLGAYIVLVLLRFLLQWLRADFYNPISQFVVKLTSPALHPLRRVIPGWRGLDVAALVLAWLLKTGELILLALLLGYGFKPLSAVLWALPALLQTLFDIFLFAILIRVLLSWLNPDPYHPAVGVLIRLTEPLLLPARRKLPPIAGVDLSPLAVIIVLVLLEMLLVPPLLALTGSPVL